MTFSRNNNNFRFDMTSLSGKKYELKAGNDTYILGICTPPKQPCLENAGICQTTNGQSASLGVVNNDIVVSETEAPYLLYTSGSACGTIQKQWKTKVEFICEQDSAKQNIPQIIENKECLIIVQFPTKLACQDQVCVDETQNVPKSISNHSTIYRSFTDNVSGLR